MSEPAAGSRSVTVVVPAFNAGHSLGACLDSVAAQTIPERSVVVVDDGSTDDTLAIARQYGANVRVFAQAHRGQGAARNAGLAAADTNYVAFLDADDAWEPDFLATTVAFLDAHPAAVAVSTGGRVQGARGRAWAVPAGLAAESGGAARMLPDFFQFWAQHDHVRTGTVLMRRAVMLQAGGQREDLRISQDLEYWGYLATFGPWGFIPRVLWHGNSHAAARARGWSEKYAERRRLCPTVAQWESRLAPRVSPAQQADFRRVRGRVAAGLIHARLLGGDAAGARAIFKDAPQDLPLNRVTRLLRTGNALGSVGWRAVCGVLCARERLKRIGWS